MQIDGNDNRLSENRTLERILSEGITTFICLQHEYKHEMSSLGTKYPPYILDAWALCEARADLPDSGKLLFLQLPVKEKECTTDLALLNFSLQLAYTVLLQRDQKIYIHCCDGT